MSQYTESMVADLNRIGSFNYDSASQFAAEHNLSVRSVISKVKSLDLEYTPRPKPQASSEPRVRKADVVLQIAQAINVNVEAIEGLSKSDMRSLSALVDALGR